MSAGRWALARIDAYNAKRDMVGGNVDHAVSVLRLSGDKNEIEDAWSSLALARGDSERLWVRTLSRMVEWLNGA